MENIGIHDILKSIREDEQQLERLIANLIRENKPSTVKHPTPDFPTVNSTCPYPTETSYPCPA